MIGSRKKFNYAKRNLLVATEKLSIAQFNTDAMERMVVEMKADDANTAVAEALLVQSRDHLSRCEAAVTAAEHNLLEPSRTGDTASGSIDCPR